MTNNNIAETLTTTLELEHPPVALAFVDEPPEGIPVLDHEAASWCTLWRKAETGQFFAPPAGHYNCPVGAMVTGFEMPPSVQRELETVVHRMCNSAYIDLKEPENIPVTNRAKGGIIYGPLQESSFKPDAVILWLTPRQAMFCSEAMGGCQWTANMKTLALGRPACAAIPMTLGNSAHTLSFGCIGMRTYTEIRDDYILAVLSFDRVESLLTSLRVTMLANNQMLEYYRENKNRFPA